MCSSRTLKAGALWSTYMYMYPTLYLACSTVTLCMGRRVWVWLIGMANTKATIVALVATAVRFLARLSQLFCRFRLFSRRYSSLKCLKVQIGPFS